MYLSGTNDYMYNIYKEKIKKCDTPFYNLFFVVSNGFSSKSLFAVPFTNLMLRLFTQCRSFVLVKPSPSKTCPRWPPQLPHIISILIIPKLESVSTTNASL